MRKNSPLKIKLISLALFSAVSLYGCHSGAPVTNTQAPPITDEEPANPPLSANPPSTSSQYAPNHLDHNTNQGFLTRDAQITQTLKDTV